MISSAATFEKSLWHADCKEPQPAVDTPKDADVVVVGGGYTGLSTALHLAQAGRSVTLFEAQEVGYGGSGRNGGQVIPGFKYDPDQMLARYGTEGDALVRLGAEAADMVFDLISRHDIDCQPQRNGWIQASHSKTALSAIRARAAQWQARGVEARVLERDEIAEMTGVSTYAGGWLDPRAGMVQPLAYARGLARAARAAGARVVPNCAACDLQPDGGEWCVTTRAGKTRAAQVLIATGAYSSNQLIPDLARSVLPAQSNVVATAPLPAEIARTVLPFNGCLSEVRRLALYVRRTHDRRLILGGRGGIGRTHSTRLQKALEKALYKMFPQVASQPVAHGWSGQVGLTMDGVPHLHQPRPGVFTLLGYNGRGLALATATGAMMARYMTEIGPLVLPQTDLRPVAWHGLRAPVMKAGIGYYWVRDALGLAG